MKKILTGLTGLSLLGALWLVVGDELRGAIARHRYPHIVLVSIDTLHVNWTGAYNPEVTTTPFLQRFAKEGLRFDRAYTQVPITLPSHASLLTGLSPERIGVFANGDVVPASVDTLAERLSRAGYRTGAFISLGVLETRFRLDQGFDDFHDPFVEETSRWYRSADEIYAPLSSWIENHAQEPFFLWAHFSDPHEPYLTVDAPPDTEVTLDGKPLGAFNLASKIVRDLPLTLAPGRHRLRFVSTREPHSDDRPETGIWLQLVSRDILAPYLVNPVPLASELIPLRPDFELSLENTSRNPVSLNLQFTGLLERPTPADVLPQYQAEIAYTDAYLTKLDALLDAVGVSDDTLWMIVSDHGEGLFRHDILGHATQVYEDQLRVMWMARGPRLPAGHVVEAGAALMRDVSPTLLNLIGMDAKGMEGQSWVGCWESGACPETPPFWAFGLWHDSRRPSGMAGYQWPYKWIWRRGEKRIAFDVSVDPWEEHNLLENPGPHNPEPLKELAEVFPDRRRRLARALMEPRAAGSSAEQQELLRSLGYLGAERDPGDASDERNEPDPP